ncbi:MAG: TraR/DksA C4-type zinc finger protein [Candidatus Paceibacterota bacterium]
MDQKLIEEFKNQLEIKQLELEKELETIAHRSKEGSDHWEAGFPNDETNTDIEDETTEVEEYENILPVGYVLEEDLKNVKLALEKIKNNTYGKCENCNKDLSEDRLRAFPEARYCNDCSANK